MVTMTSELSHRRKRYSSSLLCLIPYLFLFDAPRTTADTVTPIKSNCAGGIYSPNSNFGESLSTLFSSLSSNSSTSNYGNATARAGNDSVYGLYFCQGDLENSVCQNCIETAILDIKKGCPNSRQGIIWYDNCELRYSDEDFFGIPDTDGFNMSNPTDKTSSKIPYEWMSDLIQLAPLNKPLMFATNASRMYPLFALAQCSSDLSTDGCRKCLTTILAAIKECCTRAKGWRYLSPSCWIRYESTPFFRDANDTFLEIVRSQCLDNDFPSNSLSTEQANLNRVLSNLKSKGDLTGFYNTSAEENANKLYGAALCRGDLEIPGRDCTECLDTAGSAILDECPNKTQGIMWYDHCLLRYSNQRFFGIVDENGQSFCSQETVSEEIDNMTVTEAKSLVQVAANSSFMFAAGKVEVSSSPSSYVLVQCTGDLSSESCRNCLERGTSIVTRDCKQKKGWQYLSGSCLIRYEIYPFYNESVAASRTPVPDQPGAPGDQEEGRQQTSSKVSIIAIVLPIVGALLLGILLYCVSKLWGRKGSRKVKLDNIKNLEGRDLTFIHLPIIQAATNNFSDENKLGEGGFGPVYKGVLHDGTEIAVKRLSQKSKQGSSEFKNEAKLIAKLQHRNLVRMLGCCVEGEEKLLIYEYLPNKSLDAFLFDPNKRAQLDWDRRLLIISGIAKGVLYLHEDSLLRVIHRDLKASNVLLDNQMNPKISDFGMAKIYMPDESDVNTNRVVGTFGYMAPEYAMDGVFSVKSDVYSYGVLLLEIISGERNGRAHLEQHGQSLLRHAWDLWNDDEASGLIDPLLENRYSIDEAIKCIHIGLLCVQENAEDRPTMSAVVVMLQSDHMVLPQPRQPPNFMRRRTTASDSSSSTTRTSATAVDSINEVTITDIAVR